MPVLAPRFWNVPSWVVLLRSGPRWAVPLPQPLCESHPPLLSISEGESPLSAAKAGKALTEGVGMWDYVVEPLCTMVGGVSPLFLGGDSPPGALRGPEEADGQPLGAMSKRLVENSQCASVKC